MLVILQNIEDAIETHTCMVCLKSKAVTVCIIFSCKTTSTVDDGDAQVIRFKSIYGCSICFELPDTLTPRVERLDVNEDFFLGEEGYSLTYSSLSVFNIIFLGGEGHYLTYGVDHGWRSSPLGGLPDGSDTRLQVKGPSN